MDYLDRLEVESIYILREVYSKFSKIVMLWLIGKDLIVFLWLVKKVFFGYCLFLLIYIDIIYKILEMIKYRDKLVKEYNFDLIVYINEEVLK